MNIFFAGGGRMAKALVGGLLARGSDPCCLWVADPDAGARAGFADRLSPNHVVDSVAALAVAANGAGDGTLVLAVKPQQISDVLSSAALSPWSIVVSIAAGVTTARIEAVLPPGTPVIRAMPNTPALVGRGITVISAGSNAGPAHLSEARTLLEAVGEVVELPESQLDAVTAISGSGPAYFFLFMKALADAGQELGLDEEVALKLVMATADGAAALARAQKGAFADMITAVASKGGTTERALKTFNDRGLEEIVLEAARAACERSKELGSPSTMGSPSATGR